MLAGFTPTLHVFGGKLVYNAVAADAPDKAVAVQRLIARAGVQAAFFAGDDVNDEPVFAAAQPGWVTVRIGCERRASAARFCIDGPHEMAGVLDRILALVGGFAKGAWPLGSLAPHRLHVQVPPRRSTSCVATQRRAVSGMRCSSRADVLP